MTETQLRAFVAVAEYGSFREAATRLHLSQSGVSRAIKSLEDELGTDLFVRQHGSVELTEVGERLAVRSRAMLADADAMRQEVRQAQGSIAGRVRLGSMPSVSAALLPGLLARLETRHPGVEVAVLEGHDDELVAWARDGTVELAVVAGHHPGLTTVPLARDEFLAVLPASHPLAQREAIRATELSDLPFILTRAGCERLVISVLAQAGVIPNVQHEVTEASTILAMVSEGLGVSIMPSLATRNVPADVTLRPLHPAATRQLSLAHAADRTPAPAAMALIEAIATFGRKAPSSSELSTKNTGEGPGEE